MNTGLDPRTCLEKARAALRRGGRRLTRNREQVLLAMGLEGKAWGLKELHAHLSRGRPCDQSSVFRALEDLRAWGWVERFQLPGEKARVYSLRPEIFAGGGGEAEAASGENHPAGRPSRHPDHHHHVQCVDCGFIGHLDECLPASYLRLLERRSGFRILDHRLEFTGRCVRCREV